MNRGISQAARKMRTAVHSANEVCLVFKVALVEGVTAQPTC